MNAGIFWSMSSMEEIRKYYQKKVDESLQNSKDASELTEAQRRHAESSSILVGCILQTMAQNEQDKKKKDVRRKGN